MVSMLILLMHTSFTIYFSFTLVILKIFVKNIYHASRFSSKVSYKMDQSYSGDLTLAHVIKPGKISFGAETYIGNWYEETVRNTLKRNDFFMKRDCGDLSIQRTQTMVDLLLKPVEHTPHNDGYLHFGDKLQIVNLGPSCKTAIEVYPFKRDYCKLGHMALSATVPPEAIDHAPYLSTDSIISASPLLFPVVRNSFIIERPDCPADTNTVVNYGDVFRIRAFETQYFPLYLFSAPGIRLHAGATHSGKPKVRFSDVITSDTLWCAHPLNEMDKLKMELGVPIKLRTRLLIKHNGSGHNLSTEPNYPVMTYFGNELEVTIDSKFDSVRRPSFQNIWYFDTERGLPKSTDPCDKEFEKQAEFSAKINANNVNHSAAESAKEEEAAKKEAQGDDSEDDEYNQECYQQQMAQQQMSENNMQRAQEMMSNMNMTLPNGLRPYDKRTAPQPNAYGYKVTENILGDPNYPNRKWSCGDTDCCGTSNVSKAMVPPQSCEPCECVEPAPIGESPNAPTPFKRLIM